MVAVHTRTATITTRTFTPPAIGTMLPIYSQMPLFRCTVFSSATDMQLYALDVGSTDGLVFSHFWQLTCVVWDCIYAAKQNDLAYSTTASFLGPLNPPKHFTSPTSSMTFSSKQETRVDVPSEAVALCRNLTDGSCSTSRYPDPHTTTILAQCTYILNRLASHIDYQLPNFRISFAHMTTPLCVDTRMQLAHPTWVLGCFPNLALAYTKGHYCPSYTLTNELVKKSGTNNNLHLLLVEFPHVVTVETVEDPSRRLTSVSDEWKPSPSAPGTLPSQQGCLTARAVVR